MEKVVVIDALAALAQENRLDTYRLLVQAGSEGITAGEIAAALGLPPNTLSFHFDRLRQAGLVTVRRVDDPPVSDTPPEVHGGHAASA